MLFRLRLSASRPFFPEGLKGGGKTSATTPPKIDMSLKMGIILKGYFIFQPSIFSGYVKLLGGSQRCWGMGRTVFPYYEEEMHIKPRISSTIKVKTRIC